MELSIHIHTDLGSRDPEELLSSQEDWGTFSIFHTKIVEESQGIIVSNKTYFTESITNTTSSIVTLVSAIFVDKMICKRKCQSVGN